MRKFLSFIWREMVRSIVFGTFLILFVVWAVYALSYPSTPPSGETAGGKFMQYFNSIKVACPTGEYLSGYDVNYNKICATAPTGPQWPTGANGATGPQGPMGSQGPQGPAGVSIGGTIHFGEATYIDGSTSCPNNSVMIGFSSLNGVTCAPVY